MLAKSLKSIGRRVETPKGEGSEQIILCIAFISAI